jgi:hypothetical protein
MKLSYLGAAVLAALLASGASAAPAVTGDYVESRSANVFVGACHHEGEVQTTGRNAILAWNITDGEYAGVSLKGVMAVAVVAGDRYLSLEDAKRQSVLYVSDQATAEQKEALVALLKERAGAALGELVGVKTAPVTFDGRGDTYRVQVTGAAFMKIKKQTGQLCCKQPYQVWGKPFVPVSDARAGYCVGVEYKDAGLLRAWSATDQNNAFFGQFSL